MSDVKQRSINTAKMPRQVLSCQTQLFEDGASAIPSYTSIYQTFRNKRKLELEVMPKNANSLKELARHARISLKNPWGEKFIYFHSGSEGPQIIIVFSTDRNVQLNGDSLYWQVDGTFKVAPTLFNQLFIIHLYVRSTLLPMLFTLLPIKTEDTYIKVFSIF